MVYTVQGGAVLEVDDPRDLPPWPVLVRRNGKAVAAYRWERHARLHMAPLENARLTYDRCTGLVLPSRLWTVDLAQRRRETSVVEGLIAECLARRES